MNQNHDISLIKMMNRDQQNSTPPTQLKRNHSWTWSERKARSEKLLCWLDPGAKCAEAGRFAGRPNKDIAVALSETFNRTVSVRSMQRYLATAIATANGEASPKDRSNRLKGRPQLRNSWINERTGDSSVTIGMSHELRMALIREAMTLTHLSASALYHLLVKQQWWGPEMGKKSNFHRLVAVDGKAPKTSCLPFPTWSRNLAHSLILHQIVLQGGSDTFRVVLLAYDQRTGYTNAALFEVYFPSHLATNKQAASAVRKGRPPKLHSEWIAKLSHTDNYFSVKLPQDAIIELMKDTRAKMAVPIQRWVLNGSIGFDQADCQSLRKLVSQWGFELDTEVKQQHLSQQFKCSDSLTTLRKLLVDSLREQNKRSGAIQSLAKVQIDNAKFIDNQNKKIKSIKLLMGIAHRIPLAHLEGSVKKFRDEDQAFRNTPLEAAHIACKPIRLRAVWDLLGVNSSITTPPIKE